MGSSNDDSGSCTDEASSTQQGARIYDLRERLPTYVYGNNQVGDVAAKLLKVLVNDENEPYIHLAAIKVVSDTIQKLLKEGYKVPPEGMKYIFERALELAEGIQINMDYKKLPEDK